MSTKLGRVEQSHNGTLFLDEVGSLDLAVQSKLLQVLQDGTFVRVGGHEPRSIATRLVSASNSDLRNQVEDGTFRLDFLFRINAVTINLPPLRQRIADLPILIDYFIDHYAKVFHNTPELLSRSAVRLMQNYHWPGNIRQLENLIRSYVLIGSEEALVAELMPETPARHRHRDRPQRAGLAQEHHQEGDPGSRTPDHPEGAAGKQLEPAEDGKVASDQLSVAAL